MRKGLLFIFALLSAAAFAVEWEDETVIGINKVDPFASVSIRLTRLQRTFLMRPPKRLIPEPKMRPHTKCC